MNDTDARRRNHWVSHIARHAHEKPAPATTTLLTRMAEAFPGVTNVAVFGQTEMSPVTCALSGEDAPAGSLQAADRPARRGGAAAQRQRQGHEDGPAAGVPMTGRSG